MSDVTEILSLVASGDRSSAEKLLPLVYEELRKLAAARLATEPSGNTLQPTALVHEAYLRLTGSTNRNQWDHRGHFFGAAAEAMRRILAARSLVLQTQSLSPLLADYHVVQGCVQAREACLARQACRRN